MGYPFLFNIMININDEKYQPKLLPTEESILNYISDYDIFKYYLPEFKLNGVISSPFRKDNHPSFAIYISDRYTDRILFKDLRTGEKGGVVTFVQKKLNLSYPEALEQIIIDFNLSNKFYLKHDLHKSGTRPPVTHKVSLNDLKRTIDINIKSRGWKTWDIQYWQSYGVSLDTLKKYQIKPLQYIFINNKIFKADKLSYAYTEYKNNVKRFKVYQPENNYMKWINNFLPNTLSGYTQLPEESELLFIASSLKDGMCLHDMGYNFIAPQTENYTFKLSLINELYSRFKNIITFYDYDDAGINAAEKLKMQFGIPHISTKSMFKDISDYYYFNGRENALNLVRELLKSI